MATIGYADLPVPAGGDSPTIPGDIAAFAEAVDPHLRHTAADLADRTARFADAPAQTLVTAADGSMWLKLSDVTDTWATIWEPLPDWQPVTPATGYEHGVYPAQARLDGQRVTLRGRIQASGDGAVIPNGGVKIGDVPSSCIPQVQIGTFAAVSSLADDVLIGVGKLEVLDTDTASSLGPPGSILWWSQDGATAGGTPWVNISGSYWIN